MNDHKYQYLKIKIHNQPDEKVVEILTDMSRRYKSFKHLLSTTHHLSTFKYLIYLYDPNTDLNRDFVRLEDRRQEAGKLSGLARIADIPFLDSVYHASSKDILDCIQTLFTEVYHDRDYREWQTLHKELDEYTSARWEKIEGTRKKKRTDEVATQTKASIEALNLKSKLREDCQRIREILDELDKKIWGDHDEIKDIAYKARFITPESFSAASRIK